ncbi:shikimate dehydrogenase family protein [Maribacter halichondriae]|uniref:shikimate dehydrogenase family protein n=1 Tax=Maribacter halichondriae TaxID=2980554 RepID=UPI0023589EA5|nr:shikimate dehydrogenase [Maribacter sp. Hal144]
MGEKKRFGLIGRNISYSFSQGYFTKKFEKLCLEGHSYENFDLKDIEEFPELINNENNLKGLNVTIPYKEAIIPYLDILGTKAKKIGAVNTIKFTKKGLKGYNTDIYGFKKSITPFLKKHHTRALILGTGGASKAVAFVFDEIGMGYTFVSRNAHNGQISYGDLDEKMLEDFTVLVNCTPLGTHPNIDDRPNIPYGYLSEKHLLFDLIYNPIKSAFLKEGEKQGATICNGLRMLELQAEKAWRIWNKV